MVRYRADVAVIGGGIAGVSAACAAARSGARVILVERFAVTGGVLTTGGVAHFCGQLHGQGEVFDCILDTLREFQALGEDRPVFHYEILALVLQEMLLRRGVKLLLHTRLVDARVCEGRITEAIVSGMSGPEALRAKQFIDCSGESVLARAAGCETMRGSERSPYQLPMSMMYFLRSLIARDACNLMMAGRNMSADQLALSSARVSTTASMMGQAAGVTSALCVERG